MTSTDITVIGQPAALPTLTWTREQVQVIRDQICKPVKREATDAELAFFLARCQATGLDPLANQIVAVFRFDKRINDEKMAMQVTVEGQRAIANGTGEYIGSDREWCGPDGQWTDVWLDDKTPPAAARVHVRRLRGDTVIEQKAVVAWHETDGPTSASHFWKGQAAHMLAKTAEARALKIAFPGELAAAQAATADAPPATTPAGDMPAWAQEPTAEQWKDAGETWFELAQKLDVGREATESAWRTVLRAFGRQRTQGLAVALSDGLAELLTWAPEHRQVTAGDEPAPKGDA